MTLNPAFICQIPHKPTFSRFCVGHVLGDQPSAETAIEVLGRAIARHGKPEAVRTDRGGGFRSDAFTADLETRSSTTSWGARIIPRGAARSSR